MFRYSEEQLEFLKSGYKSKSLDELTELFNQAFELDKSRGQIKSALKNHGFKCGRKAGSINKGISRLFTNSQIEFIKEKYQELDCEQVAKMLNKTCGKTFTAAQIKSFVKNHKITCGRTGHFEKGHTPHNKGTKGLMKANKTSFKKGVTPVNHRPVNSERINVDGYREIKVAEPNKWELKHRRIWELNHGPIPEDHNIRFKDGERLNCDLENLELIPKTLHLRLNQNKLNEAPQEFKSTIRAISELEVKAFERARE